MSLISLRSAFLFVAFLPVACMAAAEQASSCNLDLIKSRLQEMQKKDQELRNRYTKLAIRSHIGGQASPPPELEATVLEIARQDKENQKNLSEIVDQCGWPRATAFYGSGLDAAFLIVQHADLDYQLKYYPMIKESAARNETPARIFAMLEDRILVEQGKGQKFGTQSIAKPDGTEELCPVDDPDHLNERRQSIGLSVIPGYR